MNDTQTPQIPKMVLIIEDDELLRDLVTRKMMNEGFAVRNSVDARGAFAILAREKPDIILLDLVLPGVDGFEILTKIKANDNIADIPVLILSNLGQQEDIDRVKELGAHDFLVKANYTLDEIVKRVQKVLAEELH